MDVKRAAELAELSQEEFRYLNPHYNRPVIAGADQYAILLPIDKAEVFAAKLELSDQPLVSWQAYRLRTGETLQVVAARVGMSVETLRAVNGIGAKAHVPVGHTLLVPSQGPSHESAETLTSAVFTTVPQGRTFYYRVNRGDTLAAIATRYDVSTADLRRWNNMGQNALTAGQQLRVTSDLAPNAASAKRARGNGGKVVATKTRPANCCATGGKSTAKPGRNGKNMTRSANAPTAGGG